MKKINLLFLVIFSLGITQSANSQFLEELKKEISESAKKAVKRKAKRETEKKVEGAMDSVLNPTIPNRKKNKQTSAESEEVNDETPDFFGLLKPGEYDSVYNYNLLTTMQIINHSKKKSDTSYIQMAHGETSSLMSLRQQNMLIITDWQNESSIMINTKNLSYSVMSLNAMTRILNSKKAKKELESGSNLTFSKTGKSKVICNYTCYQYIAIDGDTKHEVWATKEIDFDTEKLTQSMSKVTKQTFNTFPEEEGYLMEMITYKEGEIDSQMKVKSVSKDPLIINLNNYKKN